jgi:4-amino-4-deoxy-L-arabinose transferase-like glycosyltransferase
MLFKIKETTILLILTVIILITRIPLFFHNFLFADENYYQTIGYSLAQGSRLYIDIWDNKPPFIYLIYWFTQSIFGNNSYGPKIMNLLFSLIALLSFYYLIKYFKTSKIVLYYSLIIFTFFLAFGYEMIFFNAENIYMPLILLGITSLIYYTKFNSTKLIFLGSLALSLASFTKIQAIIQIIFILFLYFIYIHKELNCSIFKIFKIASFIVFTILTPYIITAIYYYSQDSLSLLYYSLIGFSNTYLQNEVINLFGYQLPMKGIHFRLFILILTTLLMLIIYLKKYINFYSFALLLWTSVVIFEVLISERNYPHYLISTFPIVSFFLIYLIKLIINKRILKFIFSGISLILVIQFVIFSFTKGEKLPDYKPNYYFNFFQNIIIEKDLLKYQKNESYLYNTYQELKNITNQYSNSQDFIYSIDDKPEIYHILQRKSSLNFFVDYHIETNQMSYYNKIKNAKLIFANPKSRLYPILINSLKKDYQSIKKIDNIEVYIKTI